jgi:hypothetical protein
MESDVKGEFARLLAMMNLDEISETMCHVLKLQNFYPEQRKERP